MVYTSPRFGGGNKMDHDKNSQNELPRQEFVKMDAKTFKNVRGETNACMHEARRDNDDRSGESSLKLSKDVIVEKGENLPQWEEEHNCPQFSSKSEQVTPETSAEQRQKNESCGIYTTISPCKDGERCGEEEDVVVSNQRKNLTMMYKLMENFESIGITTNPKLFTKLSDEQKQLWFQHFNDLVTEKLSCKFQSTTSPDMAKCDVDVVYCKNLFLKDRKGQFYLVMAEESCSVDLKQLKQQLNVSRNLSFADEGKLASILQVQPGEVTPFAIMHESARDVRVIVHESLSTVLETNFPMAFHPFSPFLQIEITFSQLSLYFARHGKQMEVLNQSNECFGVTQTVSMTRIRKDSSKRANESKENGETSKQLHDKSKSVSLAFEDEISFVEEEFDTATDGKITADYFLHNPAKSTMSDRREQTPYEKYVDKESTRQAKKVIVRHHERKGKLKSFIKKNSGPLDETDNGSLPAPLLNLNKDEREVTSIKYTAKDDNDILVATDKVIDKDHGATSLYTLSPKSTLPEIEHFYNSLSIHKVSYREVDMASTTSTNIGPAVGVRCFLMKDRNKVKNYFLVISHEFYELDYGRLKKALHPKKHLDECHADEVMDILGVDQQHVTPFAVMNARAARNNVQVFFTQKITPYEIVFCIQHPFAQGHRVLMKSNDLKCFIQKFTSNGFVGMVEEKVWVEKYNKAFSQFYDKELINPKSRQEINGDGITPPSSDDLALRIRNEQSMNGETLNGRTETRKAVTDYNSNDFRVVYSRLKNIIQNMLNRVIVNGGYFPWQLLQPLCQVVDPSGTPVDPEDFQFRYMGNDNVSLPRKKKEEFETENESYRSNESQQRSNKESLISNTEVTKIEDRSLSCKTKKDFDFEDWKESRDKILNPFFHSLMEKEMKITIDDIHRLLDENHIDYVIGVRTVSCGDDDDDADKNSQVCHTLHLTDESGQSHYIIVGRESEHISIKRFRRRFQVRKRVFLVSQNDQIFGSNPFSTFLSISQDGGCEMSRESEPKIKYHLVLYTSIYMDPDMECVFKLNDNGTSVCLSSEQFENYGKQVGMEIWYMP